MNKKIFLKKKIFILFLFILINLIVYSSSVQAKSLGEIINKIKRIFVGVDSEPIGKPETVSRGGIARDRCPQVKKQLTAIVPTTQNGWGYLEDTISDQPNFWFYVPYYKKTQIDTEKVLEFVLIDEQEQEIYAATFPWIKSPGIVNIRLPKLSSQLVDEQTYRWVFSVVCNPQNRSGDATVNGFIKKVSPTEDLQALRETDDLITLMSSYADHRLWYETLDILGTAIQESHDIDNKTINELEETWQDILSAVNLNDISNELILPCQSSDMCLLTQDSKEN